MKILFLPILVLVLGSCSTTTTDLTKALAGPEMVAMPQPILGRIRVAWNPVKTATGYRLYYGTKSRVYTTKIDVGAVTIYTVTKLPMNVRQYLAVTAYNGPFESKYSNQVYSKPVQ